jgi:hypothetical protein
VQAENAKTLEQKRIDDRERHAAEAQAEGNHQAAESFREEAAADTEKIRQTQAALDQLKASDQTPTLTQKLSDLTKERDSLSTQVRELRAENDQLKSASQTTQPATYADAKVPDASNRSAGSSNTSSPSNQSRKPGAIGAIDRNLDEAEVRQAVDRFNQALNAMNMDKLHDAWPTMSPKQAKSYKQLFADSSKIDSRLSVIPDSIKFTGDTAELECQQTIAMTLEGHKNSSSPRLRIRLRKTDNGWVVDQVESRQEISHPVK